MRFSNDIKPKAKAGRTNAQVYDQGYTYNEAGFTYNEAGVAYGGVYDHDIYPLISKSREVRPMIVRASDFRGSANSNSGVPIGLLMALTYA